MSENDCNENWGYLTERQVEIVPEGAFFYVQFVKCLLSTPAPADKEHGSKAAEWDQE